MPHASITCSHPPRTPPPHAEVLAHSRSCRLGEAGAAPETHEQRIAVHRVLKDRSFASAVRARASDGTGSLAGALLDTTTAKIRGLVARRGITGMLALKRDAAGRINGGRFLGGRVRGSFTHSEFVAFAEAAGWFLTQDEASALWSCAREIGRAFV